MDYIIRNLNKTFRLCNLESNHVSEKRLPDYVIQNIIEGHFQKFKNLWR